MTAAELRELAADCLLLAGASLELGCSPETQNNWAEIKAICEARADHDDHVRACWVIPDPTKEPEPENDDIPVEHD